MADAMTEKELRRLVRDIVGEAIRRKPRIPVTRALPWAIAIMSLGALILDLVIDR